MLALIIVPQRLTTSGNQEFERLPAIEFDRSMTNQHLCPCCAYILLRHIHHGHVDWRCRHCYESMPAWSPLANATATCHRDDAIYDRNGANS